MKTCDGNKWLNNPDDSNKSRWSSWFIHAQAALFTQADPGSILHSINIHIYCFYRYSTLAYIYINFMLFFFVWICIPPKKCCKDAQRCCHYSSSNVSDMYKFPMEIFLRYIATNSKTYNFIRNILPMLNQCSCMLRLYQHKICF